MQEKKYAIAIGTTPINKKLNFSITDINNKNISYEISDDSVSITAIQSGDIHYTPEYIAYAAIFKELFRINKKLEKLEENVKDLQDENALLKDYLNGFHPK